jgi:hypothetical protein
MSSQSAPNSVLSMHAKTHGLLKPTAGGSSLNKGRAPGTVPQVAQLIVALAQ